MLEVVLGTDFYKVKGDLILSVIVNFEGVSDFLTDKENV